MHLVLKSNDYLPFSSGVKSTLASAAGFSFSKINKTFVKNIYYNKLQIDLYTIYSNEFIEFITEIIYIYKYCTIFK